MAFEFLRSFIENNDTKKDIKKLDKYVAQINSYADAMSKLSDEALRAKTDEFKSRLAKGETLDSSLFLSIHLSKIRFECFRFHCCNSRPCSFQ